MRIIGTGIDLCHLPHLSSLLTRRSPLRLARRIFGPKEYDLFLDTFSGCHQQQLEARFETSTLWTHLPVQQKRLVTYLGGRWAAKEATIKALYPYDKLSAKDVVILKRQGKPYAELPPHVITKEGIDASHISISHDGEYAVAIAILEGTPPVDKCPNLISLD
ncbi:4'-phosphopantetheinyl transferase superfamily [Phlyctochytrium arcticum]|nr:4'-phosphopantetheinyl transferase superfamily [Phlyctochytrium arcticum]